MPDFSAAVIGVRMIGGERGGLRSVSHSCLLSPLGYGGTERYCYGVTDDIPDNKGNVWMKIRGGAVTLNHPTKWEECSVCFTVHPNVEIVRLLLVYGARITDFELDAARKNPNPDFLRTLQSHQRKPYSRPAPLPDLPPVPSPLELATAALTAQIRELEDRLAALHMNVQAKEARNQSASSSVLNCQLPSQVFTRDQRWDYSRQLSTFTSNHSYHQRRSAALNERNGSLQIRNVALMRVPAGSSASLPCPTLTIV
ncbi:hypothetical protein M427DRAFT_51148 [Gonapodya prolifera JEL478]|uniref:Uncharacterized protein n=1 Tax=Gonapodya prolifera (strain JEL478) TaxID=1344416 RepID=A0A139AYJ5_GONPJ|nr:hypothetical protein M427DRAFT_51148 [Gonapodya prolifera JEL478]|eukprot:KXS21770.1 hypothetical protein M427DRAFT_51148 [Gonapodya prolifera JEL478]